MIRPLWSLLLVAGLSVATVGCKDDHDMVAPVMTSDLLAPVPKNDTQFIDALVPHHEMAIEMADMVLMKGSRADVKAFAQRMKDAQRAEITQMKAARRALTGSDVVPMLMDEHMERDMAQMRALTGEALDMHFLEDMIPHHAGAIQLAHNALPNLVRTDMQTLARKVVEDQAGEIAEIKALMDMGGMHM